ncbi:MAG: hypothetical protein J2P17_20320, partial [Mycobacterium sp.]|nr:hypothetical protein [Mycobacterium sp.]
LSADHPELVGLMNIEGRQDTAHLDYLYDTYVQPSMARVAPLLEDLAAAARIRRVPLRTFHFLVVHGGAAAHTLIGLARHFDPTSPLEPREVTRHAALVADLLIGGLRLDPPQTRKS